MVSGPITSRAIEGEKVEAVTDFVLEGLQNHYSDCSHKIRRHLLLGRKAVANLEY